jgi:hypothetical protein
LSAHFDLAASFQHAAGKANDRELNNSGDHCQSWIAITGHIVNHRFGKLARRVVECLFFWINSSKPGCLALPRQSGS